MNYVFELGPSLQDRDERLAKWEADPEWVDVQTEPELAKALGTSITQAIGSLTMLAILKPDATLRGNRLAFSSPEMQGDSNIHILPTNILSITGFDNEKIHEWSKSIQAAVEDKPMQFDFTNPNQKLLDDGLNVASIWFDGSHYGINRRSNLQTYPAPNGQELATFYQDAWSVWDYNATKRPQRIAERDQIINYAMSLVESIKSNEDIETICQALCTAATLYNDHFEIGVRYGSNRGDRDADSFTHQEIIETQATKALHGEHLTTLQTMLIEKTKDIADPLQLAIVRYWALTTGLCVLYDPAIKETNPDIAFIPQLTNKINETMDAASWTTETLKEYLRTMFSAGASWYTDMFMKEFGGHKFQLMAHPQSEPLTPTEFREVNYNRSLVPLWEELASIDFPPPPEMIESILELDRLVEDKRRASDREQSDYIYSELEKVRAKVWDFIESYDKKLEEPLARYHRKICDELGIAPNVSQRALVIEGIMLAREISRLAEEACTIN